MLYRVSTSKEAGREVLSPLPFSSYNLEKGLEELIARQINEMFVEDGALMTIFQERAWQEEPDICALDRDGNLVIFELKRDLVTPDAVLQIIRYSQKLAQNTYAELDAMYRKYCETDIVNVDDSHLDNAHKAAFELAEKLSTDKFNRKQKLFLVGNGADEQAVKVLTHWREIGLDIDFIPYRLYKVGDETLFEFFTKPFDFHIPSTEPRGILFDTNLSYNENSVWEMINGSKASAYGGSSHYALRPHKGDIVILYHKGYGAIAAGVVLSNKPDHDIANDEECYRKLRFLTPVPKTQSDLEAYNVSASEISQITGKTFYWASTVKAPYLTKEETDLIVNELKRKYGVDGGK